MTTTDENETKKFLFSKKKLTTISRERMDFSISVPKEWLSRRREQVAEDTEASRKNRAKKKREEEELRLENHRLREERTELLRKVTELEEKVRNLREPNEDLENELLRAQLEQHRSFIMGFLEQVSEIEPSEETSLTELSKQGRDFAMMQCLRIISESQTNKSGVWKRALFPSDAPLPGKSEITAWYSRGSSGMTTLRVDMVLPRLSAKPARDFLVTPWWEIDTFKSVFGDGVVSARELPEFAVDSEDEKLTAFHCREPVASKFRDVVFLCALGKTVLGKSTLQLDPGRGPTLSQSFNNQDPTISSKKKAKTDPLDWGICGTAEVFYALRTVTGHGQVGDNDSVERLLSTGIEGIFCWNEDIESNDATVAGSCAREIHILSLPPDFRFQAIGGVKDFVTEDGWLGDKLYSVVLNFLKLFYGA